MGESLWQRFQEITQPKGDKKGKGQYSPWFIVALVAAGIFFMYITTLTGGGTPAAPPEQAAPKDSQAAAGTLAAYKEQLERDLQDDLLAIRGVQDATVFVYLDSGPVKEYLNNEEITKRNTEEEDGGGGTRIIGEETSRTETVMQQDSSMQEAVVVRELTPPVAGAMVTIKGDGGLRLLEDVAQAVSTALNLPAHRVKVCAMD